MAISTTAALLGAGGALLGYKSSKDAQKSAEKQQQQAIEAAKMDPRVAAMLYGNGTNNGLLGQYQALGQAPQSEGLMAFGKGSDAYLGSNGLQDMQSMRGAANSLMSSAISAPQMQASHSPGAQTAGPSHMSAAQTPGVSHMSASLAGSPTMMGAASVQSPGQIGAYGAEMQWNTGEKYSAPDAMQAAQMGAAPQMAAARVNAPSQNALDLDDAYQNFIYGERGNNPFLTGAIGKGINQSKNAFDAMVGDAKQATNDVLGGIRSNSVLSGQYGGSRQGIAEGRAIESMNQNLARAASQFGQNNTDAAVAAQAGAYESDSNRALAATQGLGAQQYGVASQDAQMAQQAAAANQAAAINQQATNAGFQQDANRTNYGGQLSVNAGNASLGQQANLANQSAANALSQFNTGLAQSTAAQNVANHMQVGQVNAGMQQQANQYNAGAANTKEMFNAGQQQQASQFNAGSNNNINQFNTGLQQQAGQFNAGANNADRQFNAGLLSNLGQFNAGQNQNANQSNLQAWLSTNSLNSANRTAGIGAASGLLGSTIGSATNQDNYALNRATQTNGLMAPYMTNSGGPVAQPIYQNTAGNVLGGAMTGLGLYNQFSQIGGNGSSNKNFGNVPAPQAFTPSMTQKYDYNALGNQALNF